MVSVNPFVVGGLAVAGLAASSFFIEKTSKRLFAVAAMLFLVWAVGTSSAEIAVAVQSGISGEAHIGMATVLGSDAVNLAYAALCALLVYVVLRSRGYLMWETTEKGSTNALFRPLKTLLAATILTALAILTNNYLLYAGAAIVSFISMVQFYTAMKKDLVKEVGGTKKWWDLPVLILSFAVLIFSAHALVDAMSEVAIELGVSEFLVGYIGGAVGTSVPEFAVAGVALFLAYRKRLDLIKMLTGVVVMCAASNAVDMAAADIVMAISVFRGGEGVALNGAVYLGTVSAVMITLLTTITGALSLKGTRKQVMMSVAASVAIVIIYASLTATGAFLEL